MDETVDQAKHEWAIVGQAEVTEQDLTGVLPYLPGAQRPWFLPVVVVGAVVLFVVSNELAPSRQPVLPVLVPGLVVAVLFVFLQQRARRNWVKHALVNIGGPTTFRFDEYGFSSETSTRQHRIAWAVLARTLDTSEAFLVFTTPRTVLLVPKRAFADAERYRVSQLLLERVPSLPPDTLAARFAARRTLLLWMLLILVFVLVWLWLNDDAKPRHRPRSKPQSVALWLGNGETSDVDSSR